MKIHRPDMIGPAFIVLSAMAGAVAAVVALVLLAISFLPGFIF